MPNDYPSCIIKESAASSVKKPRQTTLALIRQFSRSYVAIAGVSLNTLICN